MAKTKSTLSQARIERYYNKIVVAFIAIAVLLLLCIVYFSFSKTVITVHPATVNQNVSLNAKTEDLDGVVLLTELEDTATFSGSSNNASHLAKASGTVTIYNKYTKDQPLVASTRLLSDSGVLFRTTETVNVKAGNSVQVGVAADQEGAAGNIGPSHFEIVALWDGLKDDIYAESTTAMTGGVVTESILSQSDIDRAEATLRETLEKEALDRFTAELSTRAGLPEQPYLVQDIAVVSKTSSTDGAVGDTGDEFHVTEKITAAAVVVNGNTLQTFIQDHAQQSMKTGFALADSAESVLNNEKTAITISTINNESTAAELEMTIELNSQLTDQNSILDKSELTNKTADEVRAYLTNFEEVDSVNLTFSPFWLNRTPSLKDHIIINIQ
ncbi:MAG: baseplate J/gp47 family protein [Candidatus Kerfeldbacteria bacterium]|nr:baseplate J/gp47 family protein [Candidatus Kerfeldbacteria bacterium]